MRKPETAGAPWSRWFFFACILVFMAAVFFHAGDGNKPFAEVEKELRRALDAEGMTDGGPRGLKRYYSLNSEEYAGAMFLCAENSMSADEILLIKTKDPSQLEEIQTAISRRIGNRKADFGNYAPEETKLLEQAEIAVRGDYIFMAVSKQAGKYKEAFLESLF